MFERRSIGNPAHAALKPVVQSLLVLAAMIGLLQVGRVSVGMCRPDSPIPVLYRQRLPSLPGIYLCVLPRTNSYSVYLTAQGEIDCEGQLFEDRTALRNFLVKECDPVHSEFVVEADPQQPCGELVALIDTVRDTGAQKVTVLLDRYTNCSTGLNTTHAQA